MKKLTPQQIEDQLTEHIPHRLCLLLTFRDRQDWFRKKAATMDNDLLRVSKDAALISIRLFSQFLGLARPRRIEDDDVTIEMLGGERMDWRKLGKEDQKLLKGLLNRANKELAHLTSHYIHHEEFNKAQALIDGITLIERLLRQQLYGRLNRPFPNLDREKTLRFDEWNFPDGQKSPTTFAR
jgi:trans-2-enoyl-CoA reductase